MHKIPVERLKPGVKLAKDLYSFDGRLLLARGTTIDLSHLAVFENQGMDFVYIFDTNLKTGAPERTFDEVYFYSLNTVKNFMLEAKLGRDIEQTEIEEAMSLLLEQVFDEMDLFKQLRMMKDKDDYLFTHSVNVSLLSILIARWLKCSSNDIRDLGFAGLLHDIGKLYVSQKLLQKPGQLTEQEFAEIRKHTNLGYNLVSSLKWVTPDIANAVLMHHERLDGSGYPLGIKGEGIGFFARVVAVADVYDAITSNRIYSAKVSPFRAAEVLWEEAFGKLDPCIARIFYDRVSNFYVGNKVRLSNGELGIVVYLNPSLPTRPVVKVDRFFIDLSKDRSITVTEIVDEG